MIIVPAEVEHQIGEVAAREGEVRELDGKVGRNRGELEVLGVVDGAAAAIVIMCRWVPVPKVRR
jgi:hypothetical protein